MKHLNLSYMYYIIMDGGRGDPIYNYCVIFSTGYYAGTDKNIGLLHRPGSIPGPIIRGGKFTDARTF